MKFYNKLFGAWAGMVVIAMIVNLALLAGAVWVVVWVLRHLGVIA